MEPRPLNSPRHTQSEFILADGRRSEFDGPIALPTEPNAASLAQQTQTLSLFCPLNSFNSSAPVTSKLPYKVIIHILEYLHCSSGLYHCALVSWTWCRCSVEVLWSRPNLMNVTTLRNLLRVLSGSNQNFFYAHFVRSLNFSHLGGELMDVLFTPVTRCTRLERLTLRNCSRITDAALSSVLRSFPNLVALDLTNVAAATDRSVIALARAAPRLQGIALGGCAQLTDHAIQALADRCRALRRVKLAGLTRITDAPVSALAKSCLALIELDLTRCERITDASVHDLWTFAPNMRELRLAYCCALTDAAFPAPSRMEIQDASSASATSDVDGKLPPLRLGRVCEALRVLDLTACAAITNDAVAGVVAAATQLRELSLAQCPHITSRALEYVCALGRNLHRLNLGTAGKITDRAVCALAGACTRLQYIYLSECVQLTDASIIALAALRRLQCIHLVRIRNLADDAVYALAYGNAPLERVHLSYCDNITTLAVHVLLQQQRKITHLSVTGIPAFRRRELRAFSRDPPPEFEGSSRTNFCVFAGAGIADLRDYLADLYNSITEDGERPSTTHDEDSEEDVHSIANIEITAVSDREDDTSEGEDD